MITRVRNVENGDEGLAEEVLLGDLPSGIRLLMTVAPGGVIGHLSTFGVIFPVKLGDYIVTLPSGSKVVLTPMVFHQLYATLA